MLGYFGGIFIVGKMFFCSTQLLLRNLLFLFVIGIGTGIAAAPSDSSARIFTGFSYAVGSGEGFHGELEFVGGNQLSFGVHYIDLYKHSPLVPADYSPGLNILGPSEPRIEMRSFAVTAGKVVPSKLSFFNLHVQGGLLYGTWFEPYDFVYQPPAHILDFGSNYSYKTKKENCYGLLFHPAVYLYSRVLGIKLGTSLYLTTQQTFMSVEFGLLLGRLRGKVEKPHRPTGNIR